MVLFVIGIAIWNRIVAAAAPRIAAENAFCGKPAAFKGAVLFQRLQCISRARGLIAAVEPNPRRKNQPVGPNGEGGDVGKRGHSVGFAAGRRCALGGFSLGFRAGFARAMCLTKRPDQVLGQVSIVA